MQALSHTLWQGGVVATLLFLFLKIIPADRPNARYLTAAGALLLIVVAWLGTWAWLEQGSARESGRNDSTSMSEQPAVALTENLPIGNSAATTAEGAVLSTRSRPNWIAWLAIAWISGVILCLSRFLTCMASANRLRRRSSPIEDRGILAVLRELQEKLNIRQTIPLLLSADVGVPCVSGIFYPAILLPIAAFGGMSPEHLRAIIAHELAHIRRWDYLANLAQLFIESLLFFNPFVWWISRQMRREREACCDSVGAALCSAKTTYVEAIVRWIEASSTGSPVHLNVTGSGETSSLLDRVKRLILPGYQPALSIRGASLLAVLAGSTGLLVAVYCLASAAVKILSPAERIEQITVMEKSYSPVETYGTKEEIVVTGTLVDETGALYSREAILYLQSERPGHSTGLSARSKSGKFQSKIRSGTVYIAVLTEGQAPACTGPLSPAAAEKGDLVITVEKKKISRIAVQDPEGKPIAGARIKIEYPGPPWSSGGIVTTDRDGLAEVPISSTATTKLEVEAEGYQVEQLQKAMLVQNQTRSWPLQRAIPLTGRVVSAKDGASVPGAKIRLLGTDGPLRSSANRPTEAPVMAVSDEKGEFQLKTVRPDTTYFLAIEASGFTGVTQSVSGGISPLQVRLPLERTVSGKVIHIEPRHLSNDSLNLTYGQTFRTGQSAYHGDDRELQLKVNGTEARFTFRQPYSLPLSIRVADETVQLNPDSSDTDELIIDLAAEQAARTERRNVRVHLVSPPDSPPASGSLEVCYTTRSTRGAGAIEGRTMSVDVVNGAALFEVPTPNEIRFKPTGLKGYWFPSREDYKVSPGKETMEITLHLTSAGAIFGKVLEENGKPARNMFISVDPVQLPRDVERGDIDCPVKNSIQGEEDVRYKFAATPLPLGGTYVISVRRGNTSVISEPLLLDPETPIQSIALILPEGITVSGQVLSEEKQPVAGMEMHLYYKRPGGIPFGGPAFWSDSAGRFQIPQVNPNAPGEYYVEGKAAGFQPLRAALIPGGKELAIEVRKGYSIEGIVRDVATGWPVEEIQVYAHIEDLSSYSEASGAPLFYDAERVTGRDGRFRLSNLPRGKFQLEVREGAQNSKVIAIAGDGSNAELRVSLVTNGRAHPVPP